jgi:putative addiction module killer protein
MKITPTANVFASSAHMRFWFDKFPLLGDNKTMETPERTLRILILRSGRSPFKDWLRSLRDKPTQARIQNRIDRLRLGVFGDCESVGGGVLELRIHFEPGYRVYFGLHGAQVILLLCGGDKSTQTRDIADAQRYWKEFLADEN